MRYIDAKERKQKEEKKKDSDDNKY